jgi:hypothetical protein
VNRTSYPKPQQAANINPDDYAELQGEPNVDSRADGGFINPGNARPRDRRMRWDAAADRRLLIFGFGREIRTEEYKILAERFEQKPTVKAIQERITKLRVEVRRVLKETGIFDPERVAQPPPPLGPATPGQGMSSPAQPSAKKAKKDRHVSGGPKPKDNTFPPGTGSPVPRSQQGLPSAQQPSANPPSGPAWATPFPHGRPATANMYGPFGPSPQIPGSQMGMPPPGASSYRPYSAIPPSMFPGPPDVRMGQYQQQQPPLLTFNPGAFTPSVPSHQPTDAGANPPVPNTGGAAEGEEEDPMVRSERELKEKRAKRETVTEKTCPILILETLY